MSETTLPSEDDIAIKVTSPWREMVSMFFRNYAAVAGLILLIAILLFVFVGPIFHPVDPFEMVWAPFTTPMQEGFILGTDDLGRDILAAMMVGGQVSLAIGLAAALVSVIIGVSVGAFAGYYGGVVEEALMRFTEFFQVLPTLLFSMVTEALQLSELPFASFTVSTTVSVPRSPQVKAVLLADELEMLQLSVLLPSISPAVRVPFPLPFN